jgi:putative intracellular protease/amidase
MATAVHVLVFDGFADWEPAFALAELRRSGGHDVVTLGFGDAPVTSMGGVRVLPHTSLARLSPAAVRLLLLPGGDIWEGAYSRGDLEPALRSLCEGGVPVAAICGGTLALARAGLLDDRAHTSNERGYLGRMAPEYRGSEYFVDQLAVRDRGVITASGLGPVEFAREIFEELGVFSAEDREVWYRLFKYGQYPEKG